MTGAQPDIDAAAAADPRSHPQLLADIAARRWDLHPVITANPRAYPALREWIAAVHGSAGAGAGSAPGSVTAPGSSSPMPPYASAPVTTRYPSASATPYASASATPYGAASAAPYPSAHPAPAPRRRSTLGYWLGGCGCLAVVGIVVIGALVVGALSNAPVVETNPPVVAPVSPTPATEPTPTADPEEAALAAQLSRFGAERKRFHELASRLNGNPVKPMVVDSDGFADLERQAEASYLDSESARHLVERATSMRRTLEARVKNAKKRRTNKTGSLSESMVDSAGKGYIDVRWDASKVCGKFNRSDGITLGCVINDKVPTVHLRPQRDFANEWMLRRIVIHELGHIYQQADYRAAGSKPNLADKLLDKGMFQGSREKLADCYMLTYYDDWSLERNGYWTGYGYVCNGKERAAIRRWAKALNAPLPR